MAAAWLAGTLLLVAGLVPGAEGRFGQACYFCTAALTGTVFYSPAFSAHEMRWLTLFLVQWGTFWFSYTGLYLVGPSIIAFNNRYAKGPKSSYNFFLSKHLAARIAAWQTCLGLACSAGYYFLRPLPYPAGTATRSDLALFQGFTYSAGCGLTLSLESFSGEWLSHAFIIQAVLLLMGFVSMLGMPVLMDLFSPAALRERLRNPYIDWQPITKISLYSLAAVILVSASCWLFLERNGSLAGFNNGEAGISALFMVSNGLWAGAQNIFPGQISGVATGLCLLLIYIGNLLFSGTGTGLLLLAFIGAHVLKNDHEKSLQPVIFSFREIIWYCIIPIVSLAAVFVGTAWLLFKPYNLFTGIIPMWWSVVSGLCSSGLTYRPEEPIEEAARQLLQIPLMVYGKAAPLLSIYLLTGTRNKTE